MVTPHTLPTFTPPVARRQRPAPVRAIAPAVAKRNGRPARIASPPGPRPAASHARCFVLLDALVATVILGVAIAGIMGLSAAAIRSQTIGEQLQIASMIADERLEMVVALGPDGYQAEEPRRDDAADPFAAYEWEVDIEPGPVGDPSFVTVTVTWSHAGQTQSLTIDTLVAPRLGDDPDPDRQPQESLGRRG
jgi:type II secretory pathway pseudopilin PulG